MISAKDSELLGVTNRSDAMGVLAIWSVRARELIPHLTEQTTSVRAFQILVEAFRLWELYEPKHPEHAGRLDDFFVLVEQAFARTLGYHDEAWPLPGSRRINARAHEKPHISVAAPEWHLLGAQKANGIWGLYRGASQRAGLLLEDMTRLSSATMEQATRHAGLGHVAQSRFFTLAARAMEGETVELPIRRNNPLTRAIYDTFHKLPLRDHLYAALVSSHTLTQKLATKLTTLATLDHRRFMTEAAREFTAHRDTIMDAIRCESLLAIIEAVFLWLCASKGERLEDATATLPVDLEALDAARAAFGTSGLYHRSETAKLRHARFYEHLNTSSQIALARSVLRLHQQISEDRQRAAWVWEENNVLRSDVDLASPADQELQVGLAWRNDYYLYPLQRIAQQLAEVRA
jgi:hypothetical protein